jgi:3-oxoacyl-[acyl-carrier protein] reductase
VVIHTKYNRARLNDSTADGYTKGIAHEGSPHVTANCIAPGPTSTEHPDDRDDSKFEVQEGAAPNALGYTDPATSWLGRGWLSGRSGVPEDIAHAVAFFATPAASLITGQTLHVSGGLVLP